jgi:hypothetical protein
MTLDAYLRARPDRCTGCGYHPTQGCHCDQTGAITPGEWATFTAALRQVARDGRVHQRDMRPLIQSIHHKHRGLCYARARRIGLLVQVDEERSSDTQGRNTHHKSPVYELREVAA